MNPSIDDILSLNAEVEGLFEETEGEETEEIAAKLARLHGDLSDKLARLHRARIAYRVRMETLSKRADAMKDLARAAERKAEACDRAASLLLRETSYRSWDLPDGKVSLGRDHVEALPGQDTCLLPDELRRTPAPYQAPDKPDKRKIGAVLANGVAVPGFRLVKGVQWK